jgi:hypothetical protein
MAIKHIHGTLSLDSAASLQVSQQHWNVSKLEQPLAVFQINFHTTKGDMVESFIKHSPGARDRGTTASTFRSNMNAAWQRHLLNLCSVLNYQRFHQHFSPGAYNRRQC